MAEKKYKTFWAFYPYYLTEHQDRVCQVLHFVGTALLLGSLGTGIALQDWRFFAAIPVIGYGFAWVGHFFFEKNKPATFIYPLYSLGSDFVMFWHILTGQLPRRMREARRTILGIES